MAGFDGSGCFARSGSWLIGKFLLLDGSAYAAPFHKLYVSDERGKAEAIVDVQKDEIIKRI